MRLGYFSAGIGRIPHLETLIGAPVQRLRAGRRADVTHVAGWGVKPTARRARDFAAREGLPYISLEDGFLRSLGLGVAGAPPHSLIVDHGGIYYDATRPSDLEQFIQEAPFTADELERAEACMAELRYQRLSKYNHAPDRPPAGLEEGSRQVLVVDQTAGDASIACGQADAQAFEQMLDAALAAHPADQILVKVHPDVVAGRKRGHLLEMARARGCGVVSEDCHPWALLDAVDEVYVVTSQLGFEALLAGKAVHCFGLPFYAGWGLTRDRQHCSRRGQDRSLAQLFAAAYLRYCRYVNPYTGARCELEDTIALLADQRRVLEAGRGEWLAVGFSRWKRRFLPGFLGPAARVHTARRLPTGEGGAPVPVLAWASRVSERLERACERQGRTLWRMEDGFVRSVGLGVDLVAPLSLVLDSRGIYYDATRPSDLEVLLNTAAFPPSLLRRAARVRERLVALNLSKYNVGVDECLAVPPGRRVVLVPGQVESDASIACGSPAIRTNRALLAAVREARPDAWVVYKPHPDVLEGARVGELDAAAADGLFDQQVTDIAMPSLLEQVDEVHTMSSLTGFEALLRGVPVATYGLPFYAGWGLTEDRLQCERRQRRLQLDELVAATLILYPSYVDPASGDPVNVETAIDILQQQRAHPRPLTWKTRLWRWWRNRFEKH